MDVGYDRRPRRARLLGTGAVLRPVVDRLSHSRRTHGADFGDAEMAPSAPVAYRGRAGRLWAYRHSANPRNPAPGGIGMRISVPQAVLVGLVLIVCGAFIVGGATSAVAFDSFNPEWDGTSELRTTAETVGSEPVVVTETAQYRQYGNNDTAVILAPDQPYTDNESDAIRGFIDRGGTLIVADRNGSAAPGLLDQISASARPVGPIVRDEQNHYRNPALAVATTVTSHPLIPSEYSITLNYGTAIESNDATVLARSSEYAYLDYDESGDLSTNETLGTSPVATVEQIGDGRVIVVGDPSIFINVMQDRQGNQQFTADLINGSEHTLIDVSHSHSPPPLVQLLLTIRASPWLQLGVGMAGLAAVGLWRRYSLPFDR